MLMGCYCVVESQNGGKEQVMMIADPLSFEYVRARSVLWSSAIHGKCCLLLEFCERIVRRKLQCCGYVIVPSVPLFPLAHAKEDKQNDRREAT